MSKSRKRSSENVFLRLAAFTERFITLSDQDQARFFEAFTLRKIPAHYRLVDLEQISRDAFFINQGCIRLFYDKDGDEYTGFFFTKGMIASSFSSFLNGQPSIQILESLEECELLVITHDKLEELYQTVPAINILMRKLLEQRLINAQAIVSSFILDSPETRYLKVIEQNPQILQRIPQHKIASFLGITPVSLSRIRRRIMKK